MVSVSDCISGQTYYSLVDINQIKLLHIRNLWIYIIKEMFLLQTSLPQTIGLFLEDELNANNL
jgi:hypothetical protein